jgi:hypothetical protein
MTVQRLLVVLAGVNRRRYKNGSLTHPLFTFGFLLCATF